MEDSLAIEEALQPLDTDQAKGTNYFALAIAGSLILHAVCSVVVIGLPSGAAPRQSVTYIDLTMPQQHAAPMTVPAAKPEPEAVPTPEEPVVPEKVATTEPVPHAEPGKAVPDQPAAPREVRGDEQRSRTTLGLGLTRGYFKTLGEGESLRTGVKEYYLNMLQVINEKYWMDEKLDKRKIDPVVINLTIARNGEIISSEIITSSGSRNFDRAVLASLAAANPLPPLPASYRDDFFQAPIRLVPPLDLMSW